MNKKMGVSIGISFMCITAILLATRYHFLSNEVGKESFGQQESMDSSLPELTAVLEAQLGEQVFDEKTKQIIHQPLLSADLFRMEDDTIEDTTHSEDEQLSEEEKEVFAQEAERIKKEKLQLAKDAIKIQNPEIGVSAKAALLMNASNGKVLYSKKGLERIQPASTAKLLTAIVAVELSEEGEEFHVGSEINLIASDSSRAYLVKGQVLSLEQILDALLLPSGNDAAYVIAANLGRKIAKDPDIKAKAAVKLFVQKMNEVAQEIGVVDSNFVSPDGYDAKKQYTTAYDMALIGAKAIQYDFILTSVKKVKARNILLSGEDVTWHNSNKLIKQGSGYYYSHALGLKTGTSGEAGRCLISAAKNKGDAYISVVMDATYEGRWQDSVNLLKYAIDRE